MNNTITHIFFDLHQTIVDGVLMHDCYSAAYGQLMAVRYGLSPEIWTQANRRIMADWDSYFVDLDLDGENGIADMWEGYYRTTRAMFRITGTPEPAYEEVMALVREVPGYATRHCDAFYPDAKPVIRRLFEAGFTLGIATHALTTQACGTLQGGGMLDYFKGAILGPDVTDQFAKNAAYYAYAIRAAQAPAGCCLVVDDSIHAMHGAKQVGIRAVQICRRDVPVYSPADLVLKDSLDGLLDYLEISASERDSV